MPASARSWAGSGRTGSPAPGEEPVDSYSFGRPNWFAAVGREHRACRERVALFDQTSFAKFLMVGRDAEAALSWLCANDVAKPPGSLVYTQLLNAKGGIECDLTVARLAPDRFYLVTGTGFATHDFDWIARHIPDGPRRPPDRRHQRPCRAVAVRPAGARRPGCRHRRPDRQRRLPVRHLAPAARRRRAAHGPARHLCRRAGLGAARPGRVRGHGLRRADGGRPSRTASPMPATGRSNRCAWRRATAPGVPTSAPTTRRWWPAWAGR